MKELLTVIVPAAGAGRRMGLGKNKAFVTVGGMPLLVLCLKEYQPRCFPGIDWQVTAGGKERQDSVANGLALITDESGYVAVHDGARPFAGTDVFSRTFAKAKECGAAIAAVPLKDTVKIVDTHGFVVSTPDRSTLCAVQTPQIFEIHVLRKGYEYLKEHPFAVTDDGCGGRFL